MASRSTWISCYGVPVNAWNSQTFVSIGSLWGKVVKLDELTDQSIAFDKGRIFIVTNFLDCINEVIHIKVNGVVFPVKVIEDPLVETTWEKRVYTSIKVKNGYGKDKGDAAVEVESDDESLELNAANDLAHSQVPDTPIGSIVEKSAPTMDKGVHLCLKEVDPANFVSPLEQDSVGSRYVDSLSTYDSLVGESREAIDSFEDIAVESQLDLFRNNNCLVAGGVGMDSVEGFKQEGHHLPISLDSVEVAKALWESHKSIGLGYDGNEEDVIRRIALMEDDP
ncbi:hypothetical protein Vadar_007238 [Vaccinium darrowii]|uniref:Uncharacterized protein n=1 Tax=Vaccinium darrowii TaxID=229202 RepID=A0ACB7X8B6_9ERIC|nr:hypothetical protein Vadar_007238 [Vaccinium darrowii]